MAPIEDEGFDISSIGGHFSAIVDEHGFSAPGKYGYESARACLYALVKTIRPSRIHVPNYICGAIPETLDKVECDIVYYAIGRDFCISGDVDFRPGDLILLVNYFGLCEKSVHRQLEKFPKSAVVVDNSQAYFQPPFACLANIYSPRKFIPVPDGGFIETDVTLSAEPSNEAASMDRFRYLLKRVGSEPEPSRQDYLASEESLADPTMREISALTRSLIRAADHRLIAERRRDNFHTLREGPWSNELELEMGNQVPLAFPFMTGDGKDIRNALRELRIFLPNYWTEVRPKNKFEEDLVENTLFIPVDHRYDSESMNYLIEMVNKERDR